MSFTPLHYMTAEGSGTIDFPFLTLNGALMPSAPNFERETRVGVDGIAVWNVGSRGEPFQIQTALDCVSSSAAATALAAYVAATGTKKDLYYCGLLWGTIFVHKVTLQQIRKFTAGVGGVQGFTGGSGAVLYATWTIETLDT